MIIRLLVFRLPARAFSSLTITSHFHQLHWVLHAHLTTSTGSSRRISPPVHHPLPKSACCGCGDSLAGQRRMCGSMEPRVSLCDCGGLTLLRWFMLLSPLIVRSIYVRYEMHTSVLAEVSKLPIIHTDTHTHIARLQPLPPIVGPISSKLSPLLDMSTRLQSLSATSVSISFISPFPSRLPFGPVPSPLYLPHLGMSSRALSSPPNCFLPILL